MNNMEQKVKTLACRLVFRSAWCTRRDLAQLHTAGHLTSMHKAQDFIPEPQSDKAYIAVHNIVYI